MCGRERGKEERAPIGKQYAYERGRERGSQREKIYRGSQAEIAIDRGRYRETKRKKKRYIEKERG